MFAAILFDNGKVLDVEPMPKYCNGCLQQKWFTKWFLGIYNGETDTYVNLIITVLLEERRSVFTSSVVKCGVHYIEYLGEGGSKMYIIYKYIIYIIFIKFICWSL